MPWIKAYSSNPRHGKEHWLRFPSLISNQTLFEKEKLCTQRQMPEISQVTSTQQLCGYNTLSRLCKKHIKLVVIQSDHQIEMVSFACL